jgi:hypothetical protein
MATECNEWVICPDCGRSHAPTRYIFRGDLGVKTSAVKCDQCGLLFSCERVPIQDFKYISRKV